MACVFEDNIPAQFVPSAEYAMVKRKGDRNSDTPNKAHVSQYFQSLGGERTRGAASARARHFKMQGPGACTRVKAYDKEIREGLASRSNRRSSGRPSAFNEQMEQEIEGAFASDDTKTYREAADEIGVARSTLHRFATEKWISVA